MMGIIGAGNWSAIPLDIAHATERFTLRSLFD